MLQILLAFLAISIVSVTGYGLIEQLSLQQIMVDQRENMRRLDVAADAIQGKLVTMPGVDGVFAPAPLNQSSGWSYMPAGLGGINSTVDGTPFVYCPVAPVAGVNTDTVKSPGGETYGIQVKSGVVVASDFGNVASTPFNAGLSAYRPVAFIIAAARGSSSPPNCSGISERNGRPFVAGGLVKIVSRPAGAAGAGTIAASSSDIYVGGSSTGSGRLNDPASIDDALLQWANLRPVSMTIHLVSDVTVSDVNAWQRFASTLGASASRLSIDGAGHSIAAPGGQIRTSSVLTLASVGLVGPTIVVDSGDLLNVQGDVSLLPSVVGSGLYVQQGGRLNVSGGVLRLGGAATNGVEASGDVVVTSGGIASGGATQWSVGLAGGSRLWSVASTIGDTSDRSGLGGIAVSGTSSVTSDTSSVIAASRGNVCWATLDATDATFSQSLNGGGARSSVIPDPVNPGLSDPNNPQMVDAYQQYRRDVDARQHARQTNHSNFLCS